MQFQFSLAKDTPIHVKFSVLNPRIPEENGFSWFSDHGDMSIVHVKLQDGANNNIKIFETMPFQARKPQTLPDYIRRGIVYAEIDYATAIQSKLNVLEMTFFVDTTEIKALQFEIPLMD